MTSNLPLIPNKDGASCGDAARVLRPLLRRPGCVGESKEQTNERLSKVEAELQDARARGTEAPQAVAGGGEEARAGAGAGGGPLRRADLVAALHQDAAGDMSVWSRPLLASTASLIEPPRPTPPPPLLPLLTKPAESIQSVRYNPCQITWPLWRLLRSAGSLYDYKKLSPSSAALPEATGPPSCAVVVMPDRLDFVNFTVGQTYTRTLRLSNVSRVGVRLALRPPAAPEFEVRPAAGGGGAALGGGARSALRVLFTPRSVLTVRSELRLRVSSGGELCVPLSAWQEAPVLAVTTRPPPPAGTEAAVRGTGTPVVLSLGTALLGAALETRLRLHCDAAHAQFFFVTDDAWLSGCFEVSEAGTICCGSFWVRPAGWRGGGLAGAVAVTGARPPRPGLHAAALRVLSSTGSTRPLLLLADALLYSDDHLTLKSQEKVFSVTGSSDARAQHFLWLGDALPQEPLAVPAALTLCNHSPVTYKYSWRVVTWRPDGESEEENEEGLEALQQLLQRPREGRIAPRSEQSVDLSVAPAGSGGGGGVRRALLQLILEDVPRQCVPASLAHRVLPPPPPPAGPALPALCRVACAALEAWWRVEPPRAALMPPELHLAHSPRVRSVSLELRTMLLSRVPFEAQWGGAGWEGALRLTGAHTERRAVPLRPGEPHTDLIELCWEGGAAACRVRHRSTQRAPLLRPATAPALTCAPAALVHAKFNLHNDTYENIRWQAHCVPWLGVDACAGRGEGGGGGGGVCTRCLRGGCACAALSRSSGELFHARTEYINYNTTLPDHEGVMATLLAVRSLQTAAGAAGGRAALLWRRALRPRLVLRAIPCLGNKHAFCENCALDLPGDAGTGVVRLRRPLPLGRRACLRLRITNTTPTPTSVFWEPSLENLDCFKIFFCPDQFQIGVYESVEIKMVVEAARAGPRRAAVRRASVRGAGPLYLLLDAAVDGVRAVFELPTGAAPDSYLEVRRTERRSPPAPRRWQPEPFEAVFAREERRRETQAESHCSCPSWLEYEQPPRPRPPCSPQPTPDSDADNPSIDIVTSPPAARRVCACAAHAAPERSACAEPCLQLRDVALRTVARRVVRVRSESGAAARWAAAARALPRGRPPPLPLVAAACGPAGACVWVEGRGAGPAGGQLPPRETVELCVCFYADCWGLYKDQVAIQVEGVEPLVLDVWAECCAPPVRFCAADDDALDSFTMWMTSSDLDRTLRVKNESRAPLAAHAYLLRAHAAPGDAGPFRLYFRFLNEPSPSCPCLQQRSGHQCGEEALNFDEEEDQIEMMTTFDLYLGPDYGTQVDTGFEVWPAAAALEGGGGAGWGVRRRGGCGGEEPEPAVLLLRMIPLEPQGPGWRRPAPAPLRARLAPAPRLPRLLVSRAALQLSLCALSAPPAGSLRVRKRLQVRNAGSAPLRLAAVAAPPWSVRPRAACEPPCHCAAPGTLLLPPLATVEIEVEACVPATALRPAAAASDAVCASAAGAAGARPPDYELHDTLRLCSEGRVLQSVPLSLRLERPALVLQPEQLQLGVVCAGDCRKAYFTVSHTSRSSTLHVVVVWFGSPQVTLRPRELRIKPGDSARVYIQLCARWSAATESVSGWARVAAAGGAGRWCRAALRVAAGVTRDAALRRPVHDYTDDDTLL